LNYGIIWFSIAVMRKISILILFLFFNNCTGPPEAVLYGDYYITNNTSEQLFITALYLFSHDPVTFLTEQINPGQKEHVYTFVIGSGGHVKPSNVFYEFIIYADGIAPENIVYSKVDNKDWINEGSTNDGHLIYNLTID